jgi:hypothetical protein
MSSDLLMANLVMLVLAVTTGATYVYMLRNVSPYAPRVQDYLGDDNGAPADQPARRTR